MLILSKNFDGRSGEGREATLQEIGIGIYIQLSGYGWEEYECLNKSWHGLMINGRNFSQSYYFPMTDELFQEYRVFSGPLPIKLDWISEVANNAGYGEFSTVAAMLASEIAQGNSVGGWAALAMSGG